MPVSGDLAAALFTEGRVHQFRALVQNGLPKGARYVRCYDAPEADKLYLVFEHESFPELNHGEVIPEVCPLFNTTAVREEGS